MGRFKDDLPTNGTNFYFMDADHASLVGWGEEGFCNNTDVVQTVDSILGPTGPPVEGHALLRRDILIDGHWPAVSRPSAKFIGASNGLGFRRKANTDLS